MPASQRSMRDDDDTMNGLTGTQAAAQLAQDGFNELPSARPRRLWAIAWDVVREPMFLLLIAAAVIYVALGDLAEALALLGSVLVMIGIAFYQHRKTERALEALRELASPRATVLRDGRWQTVAGREVVAGDLLRVKEGDRVPADATLQSATSLMADESLLTGESVPVGKRAASSAVGWARPGGDDLPHVYSGTLITRGQGVARAIATGPRTEIGRIGAALQSIEPEPSPLQREMRRAVLVFAAIGASLCVALTLLYVATRGDWLQGVLAGITLAMANLPEEFPVVLTVFMAIGAWRISKRGVLMRRTPAIEALGATQVLCVDKTGTLTQNRMEVARLWAEGCVIEADGPAAPVSERLIESCVLASEPEPFDPMEQAFWRFARDRFPARTAAIARLQAVHAYPLTPEQLSVARVWRVDEHRCVIAAKGAPEAIAALCDLDAVTREAMSDAVLAMTRDGLRVLAAAVSDAPVGGDGAYVWPACQRALRLRLVGLVGLADPVRPAVPAAIAECYRAGIRTVMITGDHEGTAAAIARRIGLDDPDQVVTGAALESMTMAQLRSTVERVNVFARVMPEHKLRLVAAFKANGKVVAMTGDGVNDAPALKAAHIGVAMGGRGSDVAREAAALVLLDDDFSSLVAAVRLGRAIHDNIRKVVRYIVAVHVPTSGMSVLPLLMGWPLLFYPVHIVFQELIIDPACSIAFEAEPEDADLMRRPPRPATERLFSRSMLAASVAQGLAVLVCTAALYAAAIAFGVPEAAARAMGFTAVVLSNLALIFGYRERRGVVRTLVAPNPALWWIAGGALTALALALYVPGMREIFRFDAITAAQLGLSAIPALTVLTGMTLLNCVRTTARR
jgi:Ca2+-transporting ATPase